MAGHQDIHAAWKQQRAAQPKDAAYHRRRQRWMALLETRQRGSNALTEEQRQEYELLEREFSCGIA